MKNTRTALLLFLPILWTLCAPPPRPETIFHGGTILTVDSRDETPPAAVLVRGGKIAAVGPAKIILAQKTPQTRIVDLQGRTLAPGFIAAHTHPELSAYLYGFVDLSGFSNRTPEEVQARLRQAVAAAEPGQWIFCRGFDPMLVPGLRAPSIAELDAIAPENPLVILAQSLHSAWANSAAFEELDISAETPDPAPGSFYEKDAAGKLTGFISEVAAITPITARALDTIDMRANMVAVLREYAAHGITSIATAGLFARDSKPLLLLEHLSTAHPGLKHRALELVGLLPERRPTVRNFVYVKADTPFLLPESVDNGDDFFKVVGVKLWYDGSPYTGSMYLSEPYLDSKLMRDGLKVAPGSRGGPVISSEEFRAQVRKFHAAGWQLAIHSQGDQAAREVVAELESLPEPGVDRRHRLEHGLLIGGELIGRIKALGMTPSFHINHLYYYGEALRDDIIGPARANRILPAASAARAGLRFSLHADQPMYAEDPLSLMATAVGRRTRAGAALGTAEALDPRTALRALTIDAAWQLHMERKLGSIEVGKYADLIVLSENPLAVAPERLRAVKVERTFVAGHEIDLR